MIPSSVFFSFIFVSEDISNTKDMVWSHLKTPRISSKYATNRRVFNSLFGRCMEIDVVKLSLSCFIYFKWSHNDNLTRMTCKTWTKNSSRIFFRSRRYPSIHPSSPLGHRGNAPLLWERILFPWNSIFWSIFLGTDCNFFSTSSFGLRILSGDLRQSGLTNYQLDSTHESRTNKQSSLILIEFELNFDYSNNDDFYCSCQLYYSNA